MTEISKLHPATTVTNIRTHIPVLLDYAGTQYNTWSTLFRLHCRAYLIKTLADNLRNVGSPVTDEQMVLRLLRGLSDDYKPFKTSIQHLKPLPDFETVRTMLELEETSHEDSSIPAATALASHDMGH
ncbi:Phosphopantetheine adenylyltransferase [Bienertia sinuspersici]